MNYTYCLTIAIFALLIGTSNVEADELGSSLGFVGNYDTDGYATGVTISGNYAYVADDSQGLVIVNIEDPANPTWVGSYDTDGYANGVTISGNYAYVADGYSGLAIVNIENPANPTLVGSYDTNDYSYDVAISGNYAYVANDHNGLVILNIEDPANPTWVGSYDTAYYAYDVTISGNYAYVAVGWDGLVILGLDTDNDGLVDIIDDLPNDPLEWLDSDGDGIGNNADAFDYDKAASIDTDGDRYPDEWNANMSKEDSSASLSIDIFPNDPLEWLDSDGDGVGDNSDRMPNFSLIQTYWDISLMILILGFAAYVGIGHRYTRNVFSEIELKLENKRAEGIDIENATKYIWVRKILKEGHEEWKFLNYIGAVKLAIEAENKLLQLSDQYDSNEVKLLKVEKGLQLLKDSGVNVTSVMILIEQSREALSKMDFKTVQDNCLKAEEKGKELEKQYLIAKEKITDLKEKIKHLSDRKIKVTELKKLLDKIEKEVGK